MQFSQTFVNFWLCLQGDWIEPQPEYGPRGNLGNIFFAMGRTSRQWDSEYLIDRRLISLETLLLPKIENRWKASAVS